jgi:hypothetical protein
MIDWTEDPLPAIAQAPRSYYGVISSLLLLGQALRKMSPQALARPFGQPLRKISFLIRLRNRRGMVLQIPNLQHRLDDELVPAERGIDRHRRPGLRVIQVQARAS